MSPQESRIIWCCLEGDAKPYDVFDIPIEASLNRLKIAIMDSMKCLHGVDPDHLEFRKLNVTVPVEPDDSLKQRLGNIANCSKRLGSAEKVGDVFPEPHSDKCLHIVIRRSEIFATSSLGVPQKRLWSATEPTEEDGQVSKRKGTNDLPIMPMKISGGAPDVQTRCVAIHKAIKAMSSELDLSSPLTFEPLPFPSLLRMPCQRFKKKKIDGIDHFEYMGRSQFHELQQIVENEDFLDASESLYLYGTSGSGKSHLLAALVYHLIQNKKRVFYIPDCTTLYMAPEKTFRTAFDFAFYDLADLGTTDINTLINTMATFQDLYIVVDQVNALDITDNDKDAKVQTRRWLNLLRVNHSSRYIFSASANEKSNREAYKKQNRILVFPIFGGMSKDETEQWFTWHRKQIPTLSAKQRQCVEYLTGRILLLLRSLFNVTNFDELEFRNLPDLRNVSIDVDIFFRTKIGSLDPLSKEMYLAIMRACVQGDRVMVNDRNLYDLRHFYVDEKGTGRFTCRIAFEVMMSLLRTHDDAPFQDDLWYSAVSRSKNPVVQGFLAEQICLSHIASNGLKTVHPDLGRMTTAGFGTQPAFSEFISTDHKVRLYIPDAYNFRAVDGVILLLDRASKHATVFSIQFTLSQNHKQSDKEFHTRLWSTWVEQIISSGFTVQSTFVWIDEKQPSEHVEPELVKELRTGDQVVHPEYTVIHVGVGMVDSRLAYYLGIEQ